MLSLGLDKKLKKGHSPIVSMATLSYVHILLVFKGPIYFI